MKIGLYGYILYLNRLFILIALPVLISGEGKCVIDTPCHGEPDSGCHPVQKELEPFSIANLTKIACPQYKDNACCNANSNEYLLFNFDRAEKVLAPECRACQLNIEQFYCDVLCSPNQYKYITPVRLENRTDIQSTEDPQPVVEVLVLDVKMHPHFQCGLYDSCKGIYLARLMPALGSSATNFMNYQAEGAVGMGVYFAFNYTDAHEDMVYDHEVSECSGFNDTDGQWKTCPCDGCQAMCDAQYDNHSVVVEPINLTDGLSPISLSIYTGAAVVLSIIILIVRHYFNHQFHNVQRSLSIEDPITGQQKVVNPDNLSCSQTYFHYHAQLCSKHPVPIMIISVVLCLGLSVGLMFIKIESDPNQIWVNENSDTGKQAKYYKDTYGPYYRQEQAFFAFPYNNTVITKENLLELLDLQEKIQQYNASDGTNMDDICYKPIAGKGCAIQSPLNYWQANRTKVMEDPHIVLTPSCMVFDIDSTPCLSEIGAPCQKAVVWGYEGSGCDADVEVPDKCIDSCAPRADRFVMAILLENNANVSEKGALWEKEVWLKLLQEQQEKYERGESRMSVAYMAERSVSDEIVRETDMNMIIVIFSYVIMFIYVGIALGKFPHPVYSRVGLTIAGMLVVILSVTASLGIAGFLGWSVTLIVTDVLPFLVLAIGVDSMFILVKEFNAHISESQTHVERITERLKVTLAAVGPSITCAALCEVCTFLIGLSTGISALMIFCSIAAISLILNYILQMTFFFCCLSIDVHRMENFRMDVLCCVPGCSNLSKIPDLRQSFYESGEPTPGILRSILTGDFILRFFKSYLAPIVLSIPNLIISSILFLGFLGISGYGIAQLDLGLDQTRVLPLDSYLQPYFENLYKYGRTGSLGYMLMKDVDYENETVQLLIDSLQNDLAGNKYILQPVNNWLHTFLQYMDLSEDITICPEKTGKSFYELVDEFMQIPVEDPCCTGYSICGEQFATDVIIKRDNESNPIGIVSSRLNFQHSPLVTQDDFIMAVRSMQAYKDTYNKLLGFEGFIPYGMFYVYFGQYDTVRGLIFQSFFFAALTIFVCSLLITDITTAIITTIGVFVTIIDAIGFQWVINKMISDPAQGKVEINAIFLVNMIASMGISVEFIIHIAALYRRAYGTRYERAKQALVDMGNRVFSGIGLTKVFGLIVLAFAPALIFRLYFFRVYFSVVVFGLFHGIFFLPAVLARFGPSKPDDENYPQPVVVDNVKASLLQNDEIQQQQTTEVPTINAPAPPN